MKLWTKLPPGADKDNDGVPFYTGHFCLAPKEFIPEEHVVSEPCSAATSLGSPPTGVIATPQTPSESSGHRNPPSRAYTHNPHETQAGRDGIAAFIRK